MLKSFTAMPRSFVYALQGLVFMLRSQPNAGVHLLATLGVCGAGFYFDLSRGEWLWICVAIVMVWSAEAFNTALEQLADALHPEQHPGIGRAKDLAAGAVLIAAIGAVVIGVMVFWPHLGGMIAS
jgi:diacylglycerol kinase